MTKRFKGRLERLEGNLGWRVVDVPFDVKKAFGNGATAPVKGTVNGFAFRTSLFPRKNGPHYLLMNKAMQRGAGATELGAPVEIVLELDTAERRVSIPPALKKVLAGEAGLLAYYNSFTYSMKKYFSDFIAQAKTEPTRKKRVEELALILMEMRDGETTPPPILEAEFARNPKARRGWERMSRSGRRGHLWGMAYYKNPESRARRVRKALDAMVALEERSSKRSK